jgi:PAS domain S-box-containing protein
LSLENSSGRILLVEDDADIRRLIGDQLVRLGYCVKRVGSVKECYNVLRSGAAALDLVLLDRFLPDGDGCEVIKSIQSDGDLPKLPVVVISADQSADGVSRALAAGAVDYLVKPFESKVLAARLSAAIREARQKETLLKTQQVLARTKKELEVIFDAVDQAIVLVDEKFLIRRINRAGMAITGKLSFDQVLGRKCHQAMYGCDQPCEQCAAREAIRERDQCQVELEHRVGEKTVRHLHKAYFMERPDNGSSMAVVLVEDITERHASERENLRVEKLEAIMRLAGGLAHEISQPLAAVSGRAELLEMALEGEGAADNPPELRRHVENLRSNSRRLSDIVRRLQNISDYVTKPYYGGAEILDLNRSSRIDATEDAEAESEPREKGA